MKTKLSFTILLSFIFGLLSSQVPQGFNYQAIARLTTGDPIINTTLPVRITIQADSLGTSIIWQELHSSVTTNGFGLINLVLGKGARQAASTVATFSAIDWTVSPKFIKTEINYSGWKTMGVTRLWSVPYSTIAGSFGGPVKKLAVKGETALPDDALFEVKNKDGQTVFAVYNEGVRVYVSDGAKALKGGFAVGGFGTDKAESTKYLFVGKDSVRVYLDTNPLTKKLKGGFAVGGYDVTKGLVQDYLDVNSDSVRIYIDSDPSTKKLKGGFAVGGYDMTKGTNTNYMNVNTDASGIINPSQNRILWYPLKNAFLTGKVLIENKDSVGENSFASGYESKAKGQYSQALGFKAISRGDYSTAIGKNALAGKINSFAFGENAQVRNEESYAFGRGAIAEGFRSFAFGSAGIDSAGQTTGVAYSKGDYSFAIGQGSRALGKGSMTFGLADTATGEFSLAMGYKSNSKDFGSTAIGYQSKASGENSISLGGFSEASGGGSTALGLGSRARGPGATALGEGANAAGSYSTAIGWSTARGDYSTAMGSFTKTTDDFGTALGRWTTAGPVATAMGDGTVASGFWSTAMGEETIASGSWSTSMGMRSIASGTLSIAMGNYTKATNHYSTAMGDETIASGQASFALGTYATASGHSSVAMGYFTKAKSYASLVIGYYNDTTCSVNGANEWVSTDPLFICGNGLSSRSNAFTVLKNGNTAIGHASPTQMLDVNGNARFRSIGSGAYVGAVNRTSDGTLTTATSDIRSKDNISTLTNSLNAILNLRGISFTWKNEPEMGRRIGFIAQEVEPILPELVFTNSADGLKGVNYAEMTAVLVEAIKEQQKQIESYKSQLQTLQEKVDKIETLLVKSFDE